MSVNNKINTIFLITIFFLCIIAYVVSPSIFSIITEAESRPIEAIECNNNNFNINNSQGSSSSINNKDNNNHIESKDGSIADSGTLEEEFVNNNNGICENFNLNEPTAVKDVEGDAVLGSNDSNGIGHQPSIDISNNYINNKLDNCHTISNQDQTDIDNDNRGNICDFTSNNIPSLYAQAIIPDFNFAAAGDWGNGINAQNTINNIQLGNPELVLGLGDYAYESNLADITSWWNRFISAGLAQKWYGALGNHDDDMSPAGDMNEYQNKFPNQNSWYFSFDYQNIHFLVIDTKSQYTIGSPQYNFIKNDLSTANSNSNIKWKVVIFHYLMYSSNSDHSPISSLRDALHPLFDQYKVDMVIQGHNHYYQRMFPLKYAGISGGDSPIITTTNTTNYKNPDGQIYLVIGTGGQGLYTPGPAKPYTVTQIKDFGHLNIDVVENGNKLVAKFLNNAGTIKDTFTITKPNLIPTLEICNNGIDDDGDTLVDSQDPDCTQPSPSGTGYHYEPFLTINSNNEVVSVPSIQNLQLSKFTVAAWFKTTSDFEKIAMIVNKGGIGSDSSGNNMNYGLWTTSTEKIQAGFETSSGSDRMVTSSNSYNNGQWHHGVVTFDGSILRLYVDGVQITTLSTSSIPETTGNHPLKIGANSRIEDNLFTGSIDEVGVWNRALNSTEITRLMNTSIFPSNGLVYSDSFGTSVIRNDVGTDVGTFFYPWYGKYRHWIDGGHNPPNTWASNYLPSLYNSQYPNIISDNLYNSNDTNTIKKQIQLMNDTGIEFGIASWWGQNTYEDMVFNKIINDVQPTMNGYNKFRWAILYEDEGFEDPTLTGIINDLNYIKKNFASSPYYLHVNGKPVIFVYNAAHSGSDPLDDLERWKQAKTQIPFYVVFKVDPLSRGANPNDMDSWYQYAPASKYFEQQKTFSAFVSPGFWKYHENVRLPTANPIEFENAVNNLKQAQVTWKLVETWNEWGEGTGIEPAQQIFHDDTNGFQLVTNPTQSQQYLDIFKRYFK